MDDKYNSAHFTQATSTIAVGPDTIDHNEYIVFYYEMNKKVNKLGFPASRDMKILSENTRKAWVEYVAKSMEHKRHNQFLYDDYIEKKEITEKFFTMAALRGLLL